MELECDPDDLLFIREALGSHAQLIINSLLLADAFFIVFRIANIKRKFYCNPIYNGKHALEFCRAMWNYNEVLERVCAKPHKSW